MERHSPPPEAKSEASSDFVITSGPNRGKTAVAMYRTAKISQKEIDESNKYYEKI